MVKNIFLFLLILCSYNTYATNHYWSSTGSNANSGLTSSLPKQTLAQLNIDIAGYAAGDSILFKCGDTFYGNIVITKNGSSGLPIVLSSYGTGTKPVITSMVTVGAWTNLGGNIWQSTSVLNAKGNVDIVTVSGEPTAPGRYPSTGYLTYQSSTSTSYTASALPSSPSFTGGEVVARKERWIMDRQLITSHSGTTLNVTTSVSGYLGKTNAGLFVQKNINTLDLQNEWYFDSTTDKLKMYSNGTPATTRISTLDRLVNIGAFTYITIDGLQIEGAGRFGIYMLNSNTISIKNCIIKNSGQFGIYAFTVPNILIDNNQILDTYGIGIYVRNNGLTTNTITNNNINRCGWIAGLGWNGPTSAVSDDSYSAIVANGYSLTIKGNTIDSVGYKGISFNGNDVMIENNIVTNFCMTKDDGGGIYTWSNNGNTVYTNRVVRNNIIENSIGAAAGSPAGTTESHGIYMDGGAMNVEIYGNMIAYGSSGNAAICCNNTSADYIHDNNIWLVDQAIRFNRLPADPHLVRTMIVSKNVFYPNTSNFFYWNGSLNVPSVVTIQQDMRDMFTRIDSNYYCNTISAPFDWFYHLTSGGTFVNPAAQNLSAWQTTIADEAHSVALPTAPSTATKAIYYNASNSTIVVNFPGYKKLDVFGTIHNDSYTIPAWGSVLLFDNGYVSTSTIETKSKKQLR